MINDILAVYSSSLYIIYGNNLIIWVYTLGEN